MPQLTDNIQQIKLYSFNLPQTTVEIMNFKCDKF
jgi:hypothetical protein